MAETLKGRISSFQTLGTLDGPGVRFVAFLQGCPLRCACCHNPETWKTDGGKEYTAREIAETALKYKDYFGKNGGITLSGGEPLQQAEFTEEIFRLCKENGIHTCLDTSGCIIDGSVLKLLKVTDYCLLDLKYQYDRQYREYVGCSVEKPLEFLKLLNEHGIPTRLRRVIIKGLNDDAESTLRLYETAKKYPCVKETELLPFRKLCRDKYRELNIPFRLDDTPETAEGEIEELKKLSCGF